MQSLYPAVYLKRRHDTGGPSAVQAVLSNNRLKHRQRAYRFNGGLARHANDALARHRNSRSEYTSPDICPVLYPE